MKDFRVPLLIACILYMSFALVYRATAVEPKPESVPSVIDARGKRVADRIDIQAEKMNQLHTLQGKWNEQEWMVMIFQNQMSVNKISSAFYELQLCNVTKQGYYCEQADKDLDECEYELDKLDKAIKDADTIKL